jgi:hypothetical protein
MNTPNTKLAEPVKWTGDQWDYHLVGVKMDAPPQALAFHAQELGNDGWELCSTMPVQTPDQTGVPEGDVKMSWALIFKRKRSALVRV